jgi:hypothetical protein
LAALCAVGCQRAVLPAGDLGPPDAISGASDLAVAAADLGRPDAVSGASDLAVAPGDLAGAKFPFNLEGIWLLGWSGGLEHFSWVRFHWIDQGSATIDVLPPMGNMAWAPYWQSCQGRGAAAITQKPDTVQFQLPNGCMPAMDVMTFANLRAPMGFPPGAILAADLQDLANQLAMQGWQFPDAQCDPNFTSCKLPQ